MTELPPMTESEAIKRLVDINVDYVKRSPYPAQRSAHGKGVADVRAVFEVLDNIPQECKVGLFERPGTYSAIVRFSNGAKQNDSHRDIHGMAVKVLDVPMLTGPKGDDGISVQDFIMLDSPVFIMGSLRSYIPFNHWFLEANVSLKAKLRLGLLVIKNLRWVRTLMRLALHKVVAPLSTSYWSTTPYQLGSHVVKYKAIPVNPATAPAITGENGRRVALRKQLEKGPGVFRFGVLLQTNPETQPIENPRIDWEENGVEPTVLAEIRITPEQEIEAPVELENALTFSPGHASEEHYPLGAINRARIEIYAAARRARLAAAAETSQIKS